MFSPVRAYPVPMGSASPGDRGFLLYLVGVASLSTLTIALLLALFVTRVPSFTLAFVENPVGAVRDDPAAIGLFLAAGLSTLALLAVVVGFGARYGMAEPPEAERPGGRE
jgi:hypothetical protein